MAWLQQIAHSPLGNALIAMDCYLHPDSDTRTTPSSGGEREGKPEGGDGDGALLSSEAATLVAAVASVPFARSATAADNAHANCPRDVDLDALVHLWRHHHFLLLIIITTAATAAAAFACAAVVQSRLGEMCRSAKCIHFTTAAGSVRGWRYSGLSSTQLAIGLGWCRSSRERQRQKQQQQPLSLSASSNYYPPHSSLYICPTDRLGARHDPYRHVANVDEFALQLVTRAPKLARLDISGLLHVTIAHLRQLVKLAGLALPACG